MDSRFLSKTAINFRDAKMGAFIGVPMRLRHNRMGYQKNPWRGRDALSRGGGEGREVCYGNLFNLRLPIKLLLSNSLPLLT